MRLRAILPVLLALGVFVQILIGESGLAGGVLRDIHATIGLIGLALTAYAIAAPRGGRPLRIYVSVLFLLVILQAILGLILYGIFYTDLELFELVEVIHRYNAYLMLVVGLVGGVLVGRFRRVSGEGVAKSG
ncbi:MAG: hypothetical protein QW059_02435 [Nitrososphaerota archaeon]